LGKKDEAVGSLIFEDFVVIVVVRLIEDTTSTAVTPSSE
jgi:hypothetical protein